MVLTLGRCSFTSHVWFHVLLHKIQTSEGKFAICFPISLQWHCLMRAVIFLKMFLAWRNQPFNDTPVFFRLFLQFYSCMLVCISYPASRHHLLADVGVGRERPDAYFYFKWRVRGVDNAGLEAGNSQRIEPPAAQMGNSHSWDKVTQTQTNGVSPLRLPGAQRRERGLSLPAALRMHACKHAHKRACEYTSRGETHSKRGHSLTHTRSRVVSRSLQLGSRYTLQPDNKAAHTHVHKHAHTANSTWAVPDNSPQQRSSDETAICDTALTHMHTGACTQTPQSRSRQCLQSRQLTLTRPVSTWTSDIKPLLPQPPRPN